MGRALAELARPAGRAAAGGQRDGRQVEPGAGLSDLPDQVEARCTGQVGVEKQEIGTAVAAEASSVGGRPGGQDPKPSALSPNRAGASTRIDFVLEREQIVVDAKMTRERLGEREVADELIDDIERYRAHPDSRILVAIVYDPDRRIANPNGLEDDLRQDSPELRVRVVVCS